MNNLCGDWSAHSGNKDFEYIGESIAFGHHVELTGYQRKPNNEIDSRIQRGSGEGRQADRNAGHSASETGYKHVMLT
jgi:hypothetical protein